MDGLGGDDRPGCTHWVAKGNARAVGIDLCRVKSQLLNHCAGLRGKGFVSLDHVKVGNVEAGTPQ
ncbi:hypothetical protein D9M70_615190 [compost metagenome]